MLLQVFHFVRGIERFHCCPSSFTIVVQLFSSSIKRQKIRYVCFTLVSQLSHNSPTTLPQLSHTLLRARSARRCHVFTDSPTTPPYSPRLSQTCPDSPILSQIPPDSPRLSHTLPHAPRLFGLKRASRSCYYRFPGFPVILRNCRK